MRIYDFFKKKGAYGCKNKFLKRLYLLCITLLCVQLLGTPNALLRRRIFPYLELILILINVVLGNTVS